MFVVFFSVWVSPIVAGAQRTSIPAAHDDRSNTLAELLCAFFDVNEDQVGLREAQARRLHSRSLPFSVRRQQPIQLLSKVKLLEDRDAFVDQRANIRAALAAFLGTLSSCALIQVHKFARTHSRTLTHRARMLTP